MQDDLMSVLLKLLQMWDFICVFCFQNACIYISQLYYAM